LAIEQQTPFERIEIGCRLPAISARKWTVRVDTPAIWAGSKSYFLHHQVNIPLKRPEFSDIDDHMQASLTEFRDSSIVEKRSNRRSSAR
jgi:hypothetical protein